MPDLLSMNDAKPDYWNKKAYIERYEELIEEYREINENAILCRMPLCVYVENSNTPEHYAVMKENIDTQVVQAVAAVAERTNVFLIDLRSLAEGHPEWYANGIHPNAQGNAEIAEVIYDALNAR